MRVEGRMSKVQSLLAAGVMVLTFAFAAVAQQGPPAGAGPPPVINPRAEDRIRQTNEARLRSAEMEADTEAENQKHINAAISNMKQDFTRIQVLRNDIARNLVAKKPLDYSLISNQTAEINKRAHRLNFYMVAHAPGNDGATQESELNGDELTGALVRLCKVIDSFTENPTMKNAATVDANEVEKAKTDKAKADAALLTIIKLSERIHRVAENFKP